MDSRQEVRTCLLVEIASESARSVKPEEIAMSGEYAGNPQQVLLDDGSLRGGNAQGCGFANGRDCTGMMTQALQFAQRHSKLLRPCRKIAPEDILHRLTECQRV